MLATGPGSEQGLEIVTKHNRCTLKKKKESEVLHLYVSSRRSREPSSNISHDRVQISLLTKQFHFVFSSLTRDITSEMCQSLHCSSIQERFDSFYFDLF